MPPAPPGTGRATGASAAEPPLRCAPADGAQDSGVPGGTQRSPPDGMPGTPGRRAAGRPRRDRQRSPGGMRCHTPRSRGGTRRGSLEGHCGPPGETPSPGKVVHQRPGRDGLLDTGVCRRDMHGSQGRWPAGCQGPQRDVPLCPGSRCWCRQWDSLQDTRAPQRDTPQSPEGPAAWGAPAHLPGSVGWAARWPENAAQPPSPSGGWLRRWISRPGGS